MNHLPTPNHVSRRFDLSQQFTALHKISVALSRSLDMGQTLQAMIQALYEHAFMQYGMVCLFDKTRSALFIEALYGADTEVVKGCKNVRYRIGEGILGTVMSQQRSLVLPRVSDDPRFLDRLNLYDYGLPFICVPIPGPDGIPLGVLAAQPMELHEDRLPASTRFLEMVANLICQTVRLVGHMSVETEALRQERDTLRRKVKHQYGFDNMVGKSQSMRQIFDVIRQVAKWDTTVLVRGESGTGKELIANAIHYNSPRTLEPFVKFNCAALPDNLLESELFGHEKGAFTGAVRQRKGRFELADGGTLFLDEIGESSASFQAKLLRILQEGEMERVGGDTTIKVNVRIIAATNRNLEEEVRAGHFREDLYYRLNVMPISLPPLRERQEDIVELAQFLATKLSAKQGRELRVSDGALRLLMSYSWPGNVRELENCLERASVMSEDGVIDRDIILFNHSESAALSAPAVSPVLSPPLSLPEVRGEGDMDDRQRLIAALEKSGWVQAKAARLLGMTPRQVAYRIQILNINMHRL
ncbi:nif-specific transcriptional activator NifA [Acerihabitans sp. KWT182]|uniref:Nif-specific regulatory protein n=1 Tax=Acerihabitans sp. KWT182 TaxID=3157919 RepID=A0AAU7Q4L3_9GAMM